MKAKIVRIGNSRGVRIPRRLLEEARLEDEVDLTAEPGRLVIRPLRLPRAGWEEAFARLAGAGEDRLIDGDRLPRSSWDDSGWQW